MTGMNSGLEGRPCETCYGEGQIPTDEGLATCPDCGGAGNLPSPDTHVEWRLREIERAFGSGLTEIAEAVRWLAFELRRARDALTEVITVSDELPETPERARLRFVANRALSLYAEVPLVKKE
jgi:hypothetical protein